MALVIEDRGVIGILFTALEDRIAGLEMTADTMTVVGDQQGLERTLSEWARARAALTVLIRGEST